MDLSEFLDVSCDVGDEPIENLTEDDVVLIDEDPQPGVNGAKKRQLNGGSRPPPAKKARAHKNFKPAMAMKKTNLSQQALGILNNPNITVKKVAASPGNRPPPQGRPAPRPAQAGSITWKYKQLSENLYNADIKKADILKDYEPEKCMCKPPAEGEAACGEGCVNRSTYTECPKEFTDIFVCYGR